MAQVLQVSRDSRTHQEIIIYIKTVALITYIIFFAVHVDIHNFR